MSVQVMGYIQKLGGLRLKGFGKLMWALFTALVVALSVSLFVEPISKGLGLTPLQAEIEATEWNRMPGPLAPKGDERDLDPDIVKADVWSRDWSYDPITYMVTVRLSNDGDTIAENVVIQFSDEVAGLMKYREDSSGGIIFRDSYVNVGDMKPGTDVHVTVWGGIGFASFDIEDAINVNSDSGRFSQTVLHYDPVEYEREDIFDRISDIFYWVVVLLVLTIIVALIAQVSTFYEYIKSILSDENFYVDERIRFEKEYATFTPKDEHASARIKRFEKRKEIEIPD